VALLRGAARRTWLEPVAPLAVAHIEDIADDWEHHRMAAEQKMPVLDGLIVHAATDVGSPVPVPAQSVAGFGFEAERAGHRGQYTVSWIAGKDKSALELTL
jgi:hypothetical protein